jgi:hypothetical protein
MSIKGLPAGFIFPAQPVLRLKPPAGTDWVHEIKHDGYRMIVHRDGPTVRLYSRYAHDWTARLSAIRDHHHLERLIIIPGMRNAAPVLAPLFPRKRRGLACPLVELLGTLPL